MEKHVVSSVITRCFSTTVNVINTFTDDVKNIAKILQLCTISKLDSLVVLICECHHTLNHIKVGQKH